MDSFWEFAIKHRYGVEGSLFDLLYYAARSGVWVGW